MGWSWTINPQTKVQIRTYWDCDINNFRYYLAKHHPPVHHKKMRPVYLYMDHFTYINIYIRIKYR